MTKYEYGRRYGLFQIGKQLFFSILPIKITYLLCLLDQYELPFSHHWETTRMIKHITNAHILSVYHGLIKAALTLGDEVVFQVLADEINVECLFTL